MFDLNALKEKAFKVMKTHEAACEAQREFGSLANCMPDEDELLEAMGQEVYYIVTRAYRAYPNARFTPEDELLRTGKSIEEIFARLATDIEKIEKNTRMDEVPF